MFDKLGVWDLIAGLVYVAILMILVRPGSSGPAFVTTVSTGVANIVKAATGGGSFATTGGGAT